MADISVLMSVYREKPEYLRLAIDSILAQTYTDFEFFIVLDDPENYELQGIIENYVEQDERVILLANQQNMGLALSLNRAMDASTGKYLARMDADDISLPERFAKQVEYMNAHPDVAVLGTNKIIINESGKEISRGSALPTSNEGIIETLRYSNILVHPSVMMRAGIIKSEGGYRAFPATQDYDLWSRLIGKGYCFNIIDEYLINYRINSSGVSIGQAYKQFIVAKYIEQLESERRETGFDSFSVENLNKYMQDNYVDDKEICQRFQEARALLEKGRIRIKKKRIISGVIMWMKAAHMHPYMKEAIANQVKSFLTKRKYYSK